MGLGGSSEKERRPGREEQEKAREERSNYGQGLRERQSPAAPRGQGEKAWLFCWSWEGGRC